jgi:hypothetical protein
MALFCAIDLFCARQTQSDQNKSESDRNFPTPRSIPERPGFMARKKLIRSLPLLLGHCPFSSADRKTERLSEILRETARQHQTNEPQIFYALREVAARFRVPVSMVAAVYAQLEKEGLLTRVRGSRTELAATGSERRLSVHGIVGVPVSLSSFLTRQKCRLFFMCIRRELRRRGFVAAALFYEAVEANADFLSERIKHCNVDTVLWYMPDRCARETALMMRDMGVRVIGVADGGLPAIACRYEIRRDNAVAAILQDWKAKAGIKKVVIVRSARRSAADEGRLEALIEHENLSCQIVSAGSEGVDKFLDSLASLADTGIVLPGPAASLLSFRAPERLSHLLTQRRVALVDGPVSMPFANVTTENADIAAADWPAVARNITSDLLTKKSFQISAATFFEAKAHLQAPLNQFAQAI